MRTTPPILPEHAPLSSTASVVTVYYAVQVSTLTSDPSRAQYLCKMHMVAGVMPLAALKKKLLFYTLTGKLAEAGPLDMVGEIVCRDPDPDL